MKPRNIGVVAIAATFALSSFVERTVARSSESRDLQAQELDDAPDAGGKHSIGPCEDFREHPGQARGHVRKCPPVGGSSGVARGDFNGDNIGDLAIGVPFEDLGSATDAGAVNVIYGSTNGLTTGGGSTGVPADQFWHQSSPGVPDAAETGDNFGWALAAGNFNGDAYSDLAIAAPNEDIDGVSNTGAVYVLYGSASGLISEGAQSWDPRDFGGTILATSLRFGHALSWGDFNGDAVGDLAVGAPGRDQFVFRLPQCLIPCEFQSAGQVLIIYGAAGTGLRSFGHQYVSQADTDSVINDIRVSDPAETSDEFGSVLAAGDFDADGYHDLVVGVPGENIERFLAETVLNAGMIHVIYGAADGLDLNRDSSDFSQAVGVIGVEEENDRFGRSLAVGDFDANGYPDLAVGAPNESIGSRDDAGDVFIFYSDASGVNPGLESWHQDSAGIKGEAESGDLFGWSLAARDFDGDGYADLAIGVPEEDHSGITDAGMVNVIYGSSSGLTEVGDQLWYQGVNPAFGTGTPGTSDRFGFSLTAWDFGKGSQGDLVIGVPGKRLFNLSSAGMIHVIYGSVAGLVVDGDQFWHQAHLQSQEGVETGDEFGRSVY